MSISLYLKPLCTNLLSCVNIKEISSVTFDTYYFFTFNEAVSFKTFVYSVKYISEKNYKFNYFRVKSALK